MCVCVCVFPCVCTSTGLKGIKDTLKHNVYSYVKFYAPGENSNIPEFNEIKIILLIFRRIQDLSLNMYNNSIIGNRGKSFVTYFKCLLILFLETGKVLNYISQVLTDLIDIFQSFNYFKYSFLIALLSVFLEIYFYLYVAMFIIFDFFYVW